MRGQPRGRPMEPQREGSSPLEEWEVIPQFVFGQNPAAGAAGASSSWASSSPPFTAPQGPPQSFGKYIPPPRNWDLGGPPPPEAWKAPPPDFTKIPAPSTPARWAPEPVLPEATTPSIRRKPVSAALPSLDTIYSDALEQAGELLSSMDPKATRAQLYEQAAQMAQAAVEEELLHRRSSGPPAPSAQAPREVPQIRHTRRRGGAEVPEESEEPESYRWPSQGKQGPALGFQWKRFVQRIQERRKWSARGMMLNYVKNGMPKSLDGPARGAFKHMGRWGWREIRTEW